MIGEPLCSMSVKDADAFSKKSRSSILSSIAC
jgi:hypothetical protein